MSWQKLGLVYAANGAHDWAVSHAYVPTPIVLDEDRIRIYASFRDSNQIGRVGFVDVDSADPRRTLRISDRPALDIGEPGTFDDNGVTPCSIVEVSGKIYLYYFGWQLGVKVRYYLFSGLAVSEDRGETFRRRWQTPVLDRSDSELFVRSAPCVIRDEQIWRMWYIAGSSWINVSGKDVPTYQIYYLESADGLHWGSAGQLAVPLTGDGDEFGFGRPYVIKDADLYKMYYSVRTRSKGYRLGYAESSDGLHWTRNDDQVGIDVSSSGWDSEMICCAAVQPTKHGTYMFYNGNNYGETGFGVALRS